MCIRDSFWLCVAAQAPAMTATYRLDDSGLATRVRTASRAGHVIVLTGAGISAESGIPTFRGREGYWTVGSREYHPQELATWDAFSQMPWEVWAWYLYRRVVPGVGRGARPRDRRPAHARDPERRRAASPRRQPV